jgi:hypothetical protein
MRLWPLNRHLRAALRALERDDRPLRDSYARRAHWTVAMMRDRLAEPGDHLERVWPDFDAYAGFVFATAEHSRRRDCRLLWTEEGDSIRRGFRFAAISDFDVITCERGGRIASVEFRPTPSGNTYVVELS